MSSGVMHYVISGDAVHNALECRISSVTCYKKPCIVKKTLIPNLFSNTSTGGWESDFSAGVTNVIPESIVHTRARLTSTEEVYEDWLLLFCDSYV